VSVLGLDLGTHCGWAVDSNGQLRSGVWNLKPRASSCDKTRELVFYRRLEATRELYPDLELVAYEKVIAHGRRDSKQVACPPCKSKHEVRIQATNVLAAQVYGALRGVLLMWADFHSLRVDSVPVQTLKLFGAGSGRATKDDMMAWAKMRWADQAIETHDQADALHVLDWACVEVLGRRGKVRVGRRGQLTLPEGNQDGSNLPEVEF